MFTPYERKRLKRFCEVCDSISKCRFILGFSKQFHHISVGTLPDGRVVDEYPRYDDDDLRAFLGHYRKLRLEREPTNLFGVLKLLKREGDENDRALLDQFKSSIKEEGRSWWGATLRDENGDKTFLTQEELEDLILNGEVSHSDLCKGETLTRVIGNIPLPKAIAFLNSLRFARTVVGFAQKTADLIRQKGYLV
jgi:hypothetical protein